MTHAHVHGQLAHWHVSPRAVPDPECGVVALDARAMTGPQCVSLAFALRHELPRSSYLIVELPTWRPPSVVILLADLCSRLAIPGSEIAWRFSPRDRRLLRRTLIERGWSVDQATNDGRESLTLPLPLQPVPPSPPAGFVGRLGRYDIPLFADYGIFASHRIDSGTAFLLDRALTYGRVEAVADIGCGYGPLAIGLLLHDHAEMAIVTDVDLIALYLAQLNADRFSLPISCLPEPDPALVPPTALTACYLPTHVDAVTTNLLLDGLSKRAKQGRVFMGIHASLVSRYRQLLVARGMSVETATRNEHAVLEFGKRRGPPLYRGRWATRSRPISFRNYALAELQVGVLKSFISG